jgi:hypothetical protein
MPFCPSRSPDSGHIFTFSNRRCMRELSYFDHFPKQGKSQQVQSNDDISSADMAETSGDKWQLLVVMIVLQLILMRQVHNTEFRDRGQAGWPISSLLTGQ